MDSPKNALVIVDKPKHEQTAVTRALALQKLAGGHMHLAAFAYHAMYDQKDIFETHQRRAIRKEIERQRTQWLRDLVLDARAAFSDLTLEVVWTKDIAAWVAEQIPARGYDLVIKSINQSQTLTHTPLDWELLRTTPCPVLLCTNTPWQRKPVVLAAVDLRTPDRAHEALNHRVLSAAWSFANLHGGIVHCAYAIDVPKVLSELNIEDPREFQRETRHDVESRLKAFAAAYDIPEKNVHVPMGKVGHAMNRLSAKLKADLMVMGTTARKGLKGLVIGNSAEKVLIKARCDVLALKP